MLNNIDVFKLIEEFDCNTSSHCLRTGSLCMELGKVVGCDLNLLEKSAKVHDIGKVFLPKGILNKPGKLTEYERSLVDLHSYLGYKYLKLHGIEDEVCLVVLFHHGFSKPFCESFAEKVTSRVRDCINVLRVADVFDALCSERPYRKAMGKLEALSVLAEEVNEPPIDCRLYEALVVC